LIHQFLSPLANKRADAYGGDLNGRMRFALEVAETVRAVWPQDRPLFFRVSAVDGDGGAWDMDDTVTLARELKARGVDVITCSSGGINGPLNMAIVPRTPGYQVPYAARVKREAGLMACAVGPDYRSAAGGRHSSARAGRSDRTRARTHVQPQLAGACGKGAGICRVPGFTAARVFVVVEAAGTNKGTCAGPSGRKFR
jgi:2,4-dienoyl-CoA reductase-like NADH-dependent reductase (Old Yellow Enzyme family)